MVIYIEANTLEQLAKAVNKSGGKPFGSPVPTIVRVGKNGEHIKAVSWVQGVKK